MDKENIDPRRGSIGSYLFTKFFQRLLILLMDKILHYPL